MNAKITFGELSSLLAVETGESRRVCEDFLKQLFQTVSAALENGESVRIKGFGTFKVTEVSARKSVNVTTGLEYEIPSHSRVTFIPAKELAALANAPFEAFEAVELAEGVTDDELEAAAEETEGTVSEAVEEIEETAMSDVETEDTEDDSEDEESAELEEYSIEEIDAEQEAAEQLNQEESEGFEEIEMPARKSFRFGWGFLTGFVSALIVCVIGWGLLNHGVVVNKFADKALNDSVEQMKAAGDVTVIADADTENETATVDLLAEEVEQIKPVEKNKAKADAGEETKRREAVATGASDEPVYDTISTTRYLTTMAKEHYGNYNLWPYIYKENEKILGHPDRIRPGTKVVIPKLSKYGVNPRNPDDIAKAKKMGVAIYAKYN